MFFSMRTSVEKKEGICLKSFIMLCSVILASFLLLISCSKEAATIIDDTSPAENQTAVPETEGIADNLPELDFNQYEFRILTGLHANWITSAFSMEGENGDTLNDALYSRNRAIEERFNINQT